MSRGKTISIIGGIIVAVITILISSAFLTSEDNDNELVVEPDITNPLMSERITSGPFQIDKSQYLIGNNIFIRVHGLAPQEKGQIVFLRPLNQTHFDVYKTISFDGSKSTGFNHHFKPDLSRGLKVCTTDELTGTWRIVFQGTSYDSLSFEILDEILRGEEEYYGDIC